MGVGKLLRLMRKGGLNVKKVPGQPRRHRLNVLHETLVCEIVDAKVERCAKPDELACRDGARTLERCPEVLIPDAGSPGQFGLSPSLVLASLLDDFSHLLHRITPLPLLRCLIELDICSLYLFIL